VNFFGPRANAELVPKFHVSLNASHATLPSEFHNLLHCGLVFRFERVGDFV
jgi:hypothetical protein